MTLILTRRTGEEILIDKGQIQIKVIYQGKGIVALGIKAPAHIDVDRKEIFFRKQANPLPQTEKEKL
ncbi:MAG: carbon storage regulator [Tatlockia sp.]|nr:carbon storage regulator [Tatlockia sp.]